MTTFNFYHKIDNRFQGKFGEVNAVSTNGSVHTLNQLEKKRIMNKPRIIDGSQDSDSEFDPKKCEYIGGNKYKIEVNTTGAVVENNFADMLANSSEINTLNKLLASKEKEIAALVDENSRLRKENARLKSNNVKK